MTRETLAEKQGKVLEKIFEHLLKTGRIDLVDAYHEVTKGYLKESYPKARQKWKCVKCKKTIEKGEKYFCKTIADRNIFISKRFCLNCAKPSRKSIEKKHIKMKFMLGD